ncbi:MAG: hypothetical protein ACLRI7_10260 [Ruthenibacterium lactatiformans]
MPWCAAGRARAVPLLDWGHPMQRGVQLAREGDVLALMQATCCARHGREGRAVGGGQGREEWW